MRSGLEDDELESQAPVDPAAETMAEDAVSLESIVALPLFQTSVLVSVVLALLVFVLRRRRMSNMVVNEKSLA